VKIGRYVEGFLHASSIRIGSVRRATNDNPPHGRWVGCFWVSGVGF
jgi:hypothetical protein